MPPSGCPKWVVGRVEYFRYFFEVTAATRDGQTANLREASQNDPIADVCCDQDGGLLCGTKPPLNFLHSLAQHSFARAVGIFWQRSGFH